MPSHVEPAEMVDYARGRLPQPRARRVRVHCGSCGECGDQLAAVLLLRNAMATRPGPARDWRRAGLAAALVLLLGAGVFFAAAGGGLRDVAVAPVEDAGPGQLVAAAVPTDPVAAAAGRRLEALAAVQARRLSRSVRPAATGGQEAELALATATELIRTGRRAEVVGALQQATRQYDARLTPWLALASVANGEDGGSALEAVERRIIRLASPSANDPGAVTSVDGLLSNDERAAGLAAVDLLTVQGRRWQARALLQRIALGYDRFAVEAADELGTRRP